MKATGRRNGTVVAYIPPSEEQHKAYPGEVVQGIVVDDETGWAYPWRWGTTYRDGTTPDKLQIGCRLSFEIEVCSAFATKLSYHLVAEGAKT